MEQTWKFNMTQKKTNQYFWDKNGCGYMPVGSMSSTAGERLSTLQILVFL
jgi:hypothetical protein